MTGYVYSLSYDGEIFYIGSTASPHSRLQSHRTKFGYNTIMEFVEEIEFEDRDELLLLERYWNDQFKQWGFSLRNKDCYKRTLTYDKGVISGCKEDYSVKISRGVAFAKMTVTSGSISNDLSVCIPINEYDESGIKSLLREYYKSLK